MSLVDAYALTKSPLCWVHLAARSHRETRLSQAPVHYDLPSIQLEWCEYATDTLTQAWDYVSRNQGRCEHVDVEGLADELTRRDAERIDAPAHPLDRAEAARVYWNTYARNGKLARPAGATTVVERHAYLARRYEWLRGLQERLRLAHGDTRLIDGQVKTVGNEVDRLADILDHSGHAWEAA